MIRIVLLLVLAGLVGCAESQSARKAHVSKDRTPTLEVVTPVRTILPIRLELTGLVEPLMKADLCARVPGVVEVMAPDIDIGRRVRAGEPLVRLAVPDLEAQKRLKEAALELAKAQCISAEQAREVAASELREAIQLQKRASADLAFRETELKRVRELVQRQAVQPERYQESERQVEAAQAAVAAAVCTIETRQAKVKAIEADAEVAQKKVELAAAEVAALTVQINQATLIAPFDGIITRRWVDRGAMIKDAGAAVLTIVHMDTVRVLLDVPARDVPLVTALASRGGNGNAQGGPVVLRVPSLREVVPDGEFRGSITRLANVLDPVTHTMRTEVHLDNREGHLRPGMYGTAQLLLDERYNALTIPATSLVRRGGETYVFVIAEATGSPLAGVVRRVKVELGADNGHTVEIRSGLKDGDLVVARGNGLISEDARAIAVIAGK